MNILPALLVALVLVLPGRVVSQTVVNAIEVDGDASETWPGQVPNLGVIRLTRSGSAVLPLSVNVRVRGDALLGRDYLFRDPVASVVRFPAGQTSIDLIVAPIDDELVELKEEFVRVEVQDAPEPNPTYVVGPSDRAEVRIADNDDASRPPRAVVNVVALDNGGSEGVDGAVVPVVFRIARSVNLNVPLTVTYEVGGTAISGIDFETPSGSVTIPAGVGSVDVQLIPKDDALLESPETVALTLLPSSCPGQFPPPADCYVLGDLTSATAILHDNEVPPPPPRLTLHAVQDGAVFGASPAIKGDFSAMSVGGYITAYRLEVDGVLKDSWTYGLDIPLEAGNPLEKSFHIANVSPGNHQVRVSVTDNHGAGAQAILAVRLVVILPPEPPRVPATYELFALDKQAAETTSGEPANPARFLFVRKGTPGDLELFSYHFSGTAKQGVDYQVSYQPPVYGSNELSQEILIYPTDDQLVEGEETVKLELCFPIIAMIYGVGAPIGVSCTGDSTNANAYATIVISDNDISPPEHPVVSVRVKDPQAEEVSITSGGQANPGVFTIFRTPPFTSELAVRYALSRPETSSSPGLRRYAENGVDYERLSGSVTIPAGAMEADVIVQPIFDLNQEGAETVTLTLLEPLTSESGYLLDAGASGNEASFQIRDYAPTNLPVISLQVTDPMAVELPIARRNGSLRVSRTGSVASALTVPYSIEGTAVNGVDYSLLSGVVEFPPGVSQVAIVIIPLRDGMAERLESVVIGLKPPPSQTYPPAYLLGAQRSGGITIRDRLSHRPYPKQLRGHHFVIPVPTEVMVPAVNGGIATTNAAPCWIVETSLDLLIWEQIGTSDSTDAGGVIDHFVDPGTDDQPRRFYRTRPCAPTP